MQDPYLTIWTKPRATFEYFFNERTNNSIFGLPFIIYGFSMGLTMGEDITALFDVNPSLGERLLSYLFATILSTGLALGKDPSTYSVNPFFLLSRKFSEA